MFTIECSAKQTLRGSKNRKLFIRNMKCDFTSYFYFETNVFCAYLFSFSSLNIRFFLIHAIPRAKSNATLSRWIQTCERKCIDRKSRIASFKATLAETVNKLFNSNSRKNFHISRWDIKSGPLIQWRTINLH